ncbi:MAG: phosphate acyltransferase [Bacteroidales bacterium]|jgi:glycerol-3-phosphate acyltransferase PlsX|nr:phosphate acyltransferase [Bacteroidales bacterium]
MARIGIDAMGGDFAPENVILGAIDAYASINAESKIYLIGNQVKIAEICRHYGASSGNFFIIPAAEVIEMGESPVRAYARKTDSSINVGFDMLREGKIDAFASAGNTGAMLIGSLKTLTGLEGVLRPCISAMFPLVNGKNMLILDVGLNTDVKAEVLYQFAVIGSVYAKVMMGIEKPKVALLNIGSEEEKGSNVVKKAYGLMQEATDFDFVGNMEANLLFNGGIADVLVTDGYVGNICLKEAEGMYALVSALGVNHPFLNRFNYEFYGGTPVLGVTSPVVIGHGASTPLAIKNMILEADRAVNNNLIGKLEEALKIFRPKHTNN